MTTLIPSLVIRPCCVNCGARDSSKLVAATHYICGNKVAHGLEKMDLERKEILGVVAQNATRNCFRNINWKVSATSHIAIEETENRYSTTESEELESRLNYLFLTEIGGQVKVIVGKKNKKYIVSIEVSSLQLYNSDNKLILSWGVFRSNSSCFMPVDFQNLHVHLDPYAKLIRNSFSDDHGLKPQPRLGELQKEPAFNWNDDVHPYIPMEKLVVYRLNVMHFTKDESSQVASDLAGTFSGLMEKLHHFKDLGVNAVLLEPIFSFDEQKGPYFPFHFFSPMNVYGPSSGPVSTINSVKEMVKRLHANGIEVLLEVVFTHTAESGALQGIDDSCYYYVNGDADLGIRNALNCNYSIVQQMIVDSLRYWVTEFHVDGFCFINASSLGKLSLTQNYNGTINHAAVVVFTCTPLNSTLFCSFFLFPMERPKSCRKTIAILLYTTFVFFAELA
ncbi:unnamed protein product, partial [Vitis vinifera]